MLFGIYYVVPALLALIAIRKYRESRWGKCKNNVNLKGKVAIVTGANSGIGFEITKELAKRNACVILACTTLEKAQKACDEIKSLINDLSPLLIPKEVDFQSLKSVKKFAEDIKTNFPEINLLINNAGVSYPKNRRILTEDNIEIHFQVNHLSPFYLTNLLLEPLSKTSSRIVVIASTLFERGQINFDDLNGENSSKKTSMYANSKLSNVYFATELSKRVDKNKIKVYACCPGWAYTGLFRHHIKWYHYIIIAPIAFFFMRSAKMAAQTPLYCATEPSLEEETGLIYKDCKHYNNRMILYDNIGKQLWAKCEIMIQDAVTE